ncbi:MAG: hypothetical protein KAS01_02515 [Candidatus Pacebacteria bacterium]|nr:hypothetical protein [Candidatus Paceibacterota bacterium]
MENKDSTKLENKVMSEIKSGKVRLRSKYLFLAEKLGLESAFILSVILSVLFFNLVLFYLKSTGNLEYLGFGTSGIAAFLESFPYLLVIGFIFFLFLAGYLMMKADFSYKKPFKYFAVSLIVVVMLAGIVLAYTDVSEKIEQQAFSDGLSGVVLKPFLNRAVGLHRNGISGKIFEISDDYIVMEIPSGLQKVDLKNLKFEEKLKLEKNQFIIAIGERKDDVFLAGRIRIVNETDMPMIGRGIRRGQKNGCNDLCQINNGFIIENKEMKKCMDECFELNEYRRRCFDSCATK